MKKNCNFIFCFGCIIFLTVAILFNIKRKGRVFLLWSLSTHGPLTTCPHWLYGRSGHVFWLNMNVTFWNITNTTIYSLTLYILFIYWLIINSYTNLNGSESWIIFEHFIRIWWNYVWKLSHGSLYIYIYKNMCHCRSY